MGDPASARAVYEQSLAVRQRLAAAQPDSAAAQRDVSLPYVRPGSRTTELTQVVRTDLGELKWMHADASDDTALERLGQRVYVLQGCWNCHSQTRRIGPDLTQVGLKYSDEWHLAHLWDPRMLVPDSIMPRYVGLFDAPPERVAIVDDAAGNRTLERNEVTEAIFDFAQEDVVAQHQRLTPNADGLLFVRKPGKYPVIFTPNDEYVGDTVELAVMTPELERLIAYLQRLGMNRGKWRDVFEPQRLEASEVGLPRSEKWVALGREIYERRCAGCHGVTGDGNGPAATFMDRFRPRNFQLAVFKFRLVDGPLPTDGDLMRTLTRGVRGTAMPSWHDLPIEDRLAVIQYIKFQLAVDRTDPSAPYVYFEEEPPGQPLFIGAAPPPAAEMVAHGRQIWRQAKCWECHGDEGRGDGEKAPGLKDDFGYPIPAADLTTGQFKSGPKVQDIFRTISTGLGGTPMPSFGDSLPEEDRWALAYYVLAQSAFKDPLTGEPLPISAEDRQALNDPATQARSSDTAYAPQAGETYAPQAGGRTVSGGAVWAKRHGPRSSARHELRDRRQPLKEKGRL
jgi:cytochrome c oxidase cbb3-type subunit 2